MPLTLLSCPIPLCRHNFFKADFVACALIPIQRLGTALVCQPRRTVPPHSFFSPGALVCQPSHSFVSPGTLVCPPRRTVPPREHQTCTPPREQTCTNLHQGSKLAPPREHACTQEVSPPLSGRGSSGQGPASCQAHVSVTSHAQRGTDSGAHTKQVAVAASSKFGEGADAKTPTPMQRALINGAATMACFFLSGLFQ